MTEIKEVSNELEDKEWMKVTQELINADITKEEFKRFLEQKRKEKNLS